MHTPVLLDEVIENLHIKNSGLYIDATAGEGGYTEAIAQKGGHILSIDLDEKQIENLKTRISNDQITFAIGNYAQIETIAKENKFYPADGVVFDLGLSMAQIRDSGKGFSYHNLEEPLDMRISNDFDETAGDLLNTLNAESLYELFARYSEEIDSRIIAETLVQMRIRHRVNTVSDLLDAINAAIRSCTSHHGHDMKPIYSRIFQALRIAVNHEFENIWSGLSGALSIIKDDGRIMVVTFHSLEDRLVKRFAREHNLRMPKSDVIKGDKALRFERSATLRIITKQ